MHIKQNPSDTPYSFAARFSRWLALSALAASAVFLSVPGASAQDPADSPQQPDSQSAPQPDNRRVISRDTVQPPQDQQDPGYDNDRGPRQRPANHNRRSYNQSAGDVPDSITVPAGKVIFIRLNEPLSSDRNRKGDTFTATLDQPIVVNGWVVARRGETVVGSVTAAQKAGRVKGVSQLGLDLVEITLADGQQIPLVTELWKGSAGTSHGADAAGIATTTAGGTIIGAAVNGGEGAGIGAGIGAAAGVAMVLLTRGKPTVLGPEAGLSFRLKESLTVSTVNSKQAFQPVGNDDYDSSPNLRRRPGGPGGPYPVAYPGPYCYGCGPYYGYGPYYYPYPYVGFYGGYWFGGRWHRGFRR